MKITLNHKEIVSAIRARVSERFEIEDSCIDKFVVFSVETGNAEHGEFIIGATLDVNEDVIDDV